MMDFLSWIHDVLCMHVLINLKQYKTPTSVWQPWNQEILEQIYREIKSESRRFVLFDLIFARLLLGNILYIFQKNERIFKSCVKDISFLTLNDLI